MRQTAPHLLSLLNGHKAGELRHNGVLLAHVNDERLALSLYNLQMMGEGGGGG